MLAHITPAIALMRILAFAAHNLRAVTDPVNDLNVMDGKIESAPRGRPQVRTKEMRATLKATTSQKLTVNFYVIPASEVSHLADGEIRHQFGLKHNKSLRRVIRLTAYMVSATVLFSFGSGITSDEFKYWPSTFGSGLILAAGLTGSNVFDVPDGRIDKTRDGRWEVNTKEMRATIKGTTGKSIAVYFTYLGPTRETSRLADGEIRNQFGVKLRAQDTCNCVYVMFHFEKNVGVSVQVKRNPGKKTHEDCLDRGYESVSFHPTPFVKVNTPHTLAAKLESRMLTVSADGDAWQVILPGVIDFDGPAGLRSDNAHVIFTYEAS